MNKKLNYWLMAALVCGLSMSVASCKDDDKNESPDNGQSEEQADKDLADATTFWGVVGQLTDTPMPPHVLPTSWVPTSPPRRRTTPTRTTSWER